MLYFAYGANVNRRHMKRFAPRASAVGVAHLAAHRLIFRRFAALTPDPTTSVCGVLYDITPACERALDLYEEVPTLYRKASLAVDTEAGPKEAMLYMHTGGALAPPDLVYFNIIARGYADWKFDAAPLRQARFAAARGNGVKA